MLIISIVLAVLALIVVGCYLNRDQRPDEEPFCERCAAGLGHPHNNRF